MKKLLTLALLVVFFGAGLYTGYRLGSHEPLTAPVNSSEYSPWSDHGMGQRIPDPDAVFGRPVEISATFKNNDEKFIAIMYEVSDEEYRLYVEECKKFGFSRITNERATLIVMKDGLLGNTLQLNLTGDSLFVNIN